MTRVVVKQFAGPRKLTLDADQKFLFTRELRRIQRRFRAHKGTPHLMAPDCVITVSTGKRAQHYALYGQAILMNTKTHKKWQFYFGILLLEWLYK